MQQKHTIRLEARPPSSEGSGEVSIRRLVVNALRMRPDRIIVGECRAGEALDMLQAMNTGHEGSMSTIHSNSEKDAIGRLETMVLMSGAELPSQAIISQIVSAVNIIVQLTRYFDGTRKVSSISTIEQTNDEAKFRIDKIFEFKLTGIKDSRQQGVFRGCGIIPQFIENASMRGVKIDKEIFK
jgi:Flp pilus assembly CpaF family ATPase